MPDVSHQVYDQVTRLGASFRPPRITNRLDTLTTPRGKVAVPEAIRRFVQDVDWPTPPGGLAYSSQDGPGGIVFETSTDARPQADRTFLRIARDRENRAFLIALDDPHPSDPTIWSVTDDSVPTGLGSLAAWLAGLTPDRSFIVETVRPFPTLPDRAPTDKPGKTAFKLAHAARGLWLTSETDAPFEMFVWEERTEPTGPRLAARLGLPPDAPVVETTVEDFFQPKRFSTDGPSVEAMLSSLRHELNTRLRDVRIFRLGTIRVEIVIVGRVTTTGWCGLRAFAVET